MMFGILGEDASDTSTLRVLVRRIAGQPNLRVMAQGKGGSGFLMRKGADALKAMWTSGCEKFIVCHDADGNDPEEVLAKVEAMVKPVNLPDNSSCVVIPVQEIEAWILANLSVVKNVLQSWKPNDIKSPEKINDPKEHIARLSRDAGGKARYRYSSHNEKVALHLDLEVVYRKCPSFQKLHDFVTNKKSA